MATYTGRTPEEAILKAMIHVCKPCCRATGSGEVQMPNGCAGCNCCPCVCWWYTQWQHQLTKDNILVGPSADPGGGFTFWELQSNSIVLVGDWPTYMYLGDVASNETTCEIGGLVAIDENGDIISNIEDPIYPYFEGDLTYSDGVDTLVLHVVMRASMRLLFNCAGEISDGFIWAGTTITLGGIPYVPGAFDAFDWYPLPNDVVGGLGTLVDCGGTFPIGFGGNGVNLPDFTLTPMLDPDCENS